MTALSPQSPRHRWRPNNSNSHSHTPDRLPPQLPIFTTTATTVTTTNGVGLSSPSTTTTSSRRVNRRAVSTDSVIWILAINTFWIIVVMLLLVGKVPLDASTCPVDQLETTLQQLRQPENQNYDAASSIQTRRVLIVGLIHYLQEVFQHTQHEENENENEINNSNNVVDSISHLCSSVSNDEGGDVEINILYQNDHAPDFDTSNPHLFQNKLRRIWETAGCTVTLLSEQDAISQQYNRTSLPAFQTMSRFQRLAKLRSLQRSCILSRQQAQNLDYDVVVNIDFDVMTLPRPSIVHDAIDHVVHAAETGTSTGLSMTTNQDERHGSIVCANGFEIWKVPFLSSLRLQQPHLYYDTLAAIDHEGDWYYPSYSCNVLYIISLAQWTLFKQILFFPSCRGTTSNKKNMDPAPRSIATSTLWPMQSCFGGLAIYDWDTWSFPDCDYDASQITLSSTQAGNDDATSHNTNGRWQLSPKYTLTGTEGGDTCEHVVFQQCLRAASQAVENSRMRGEHDQDYRHKLLPQLEVGIMSDFVVEREASLLATRAARTKTFFIVLGVLGSFFGLILLCITARRKR